MPTCMRTRSTSFSTRACAASGPYAPITALPSTRSKTQQSRRFTGGFSIGARVQSPTDVDHAGAAVTADALAEAVEHHARGRLSQAEAGYRSVLQSAPDHPDALHRLG